MLMKYKLFTCAALAVTLAIAGLVDRSVGQPAPAPSVTKAVTDRVER